MLVPRQSVPAVQPGRPGAAPASRSANDFKLLDDAYLRKHFGKDMAPRALYLDSFRRPLITFPATQEEQFNFNMYRKTKINQGILDGKYDTSMAIVAPSIFPYARDNKEQKTKGQGTSGADEVIYVMQLPDCVCKCPVHSNQAVVMPRFVWYSSKKSKGAKGGDECATNSAAHKPGPGANNRPKPWLLSRLTDFDLLSQW